MFTLARGLFKYPSVWLDEAKTANTCISPSLLGIKPIKPCG